MSDPQQQPWSASGRVVGRVAALWRYPVKSMREPVPETAVSWHGLARLPVADESPATGRRATAFPG
jgi:hypothetical protein